MYNLWIHKMQNNKFRRLKQSKSKNQTIMCTYFCTRYSCKTRSFHEVTTSNKSVYIFVLIKKTWCLSCSRRTVIRLSKLLRSVKRRACGKSKPFCASRRVRWTRGCKYSSNTAPKIYKRSLIWQWCLKCRTSSCGMPSSAKRAKIIQK